jgi:hypothetical protein
MAERPIAWEPIPRDANHYMAVQVVHFEERTSDEGTPVTIVLAATTGQAAREEGGRAAWRLAFVTVAAFQRRSLSIWWPGSRPMTIPVGHGKARDRLEVATWEIVQSAWLRECVPPNTYSGTIHHYVIADYEDAYEIAALGWMSEQLPPGWEQVYGA